MKSEFTKLKNSLNDLEYLALSDQQRRVYDVLILGKGLSNIIALASHGVGSLSSRIAELRSKGLDIVSEYKKDTMNKSYVAYRLRKAGEIEA